MISRNYLPIILILILASFSLNAQDCSNSKAYKHCDPPKDTRFENKMNWSKGIRKGQTKQYLLTFTKGQQYYISVCSSKSSINLHIKLLEDNESKDVLYDNAINEMSGILEITMQETKKMIIEISVPPNEIDELKNSTICVGLRVFNKKAKLKN